MRAGVLARLRKEPGNWIVTKPFRRGGDVLGALAEAIPPATVPIECPAVPIFGRHFVPGMLGPFAVAIGLTCDTAAVVVRPIPSDPTSASASAMETDENPAVTLSICWSFKGWGWPAAATPAMNGNAVKAISSFFISLS
jgi:hypothetical protein